MFISYSLFSKTFLSNWFMNKSEIYGQVHYKTLVKLIIFLNLSFKCILENLIHVVIIQVALSHLKRDCKHRKKYVILYLRLF